MQQEPQKVIGAGNGSLVAGFIESVVPSELNSCAKLFLTGALVNGVSNGVFNSIMQLYLISMGFSAVELGTLFIFNPLFCVLLSIPCGIAADRYGKRKMILLGFAALLIGGPIFFFADSLPLLAVTFSMFGISNAAATVFTPLYTSFYEKHDLEKAFGLYGLLNISAMSLGSLAGYIPSYMISKYAFTEFSSYRLVILVAFLLFIAQYVFYLASSNGMEEKLSNGFKFKLNS